MWVGIDGAKGWQSGGGMEIKMIFCCVRELATEFNAEMQRAEVVVSQVMGRISYTLALTPEERAKRSPRPGKKVASWLGES